MPSSPPGTTAATAVPRRGKQSRGAATILIVDDEEANRFLLHDILSHQGYSILEAANGREALEVAEANAPDAVLLDVMMPEMDGFETCRRLKASEATRRLPILMVSALADRDNQCEGIAAGAQDFLTKPVDMRDLLLRVDNAVQHKRFVDELLDGTGATNGETGGQQAAIREVVHDLRSPLGGVTGNLQLLKLVAGSQLDEEALGYLHESLESLDDLTGRIDTLLTPSTVPS